MFEYGGMSVTSLPTGRNAAQRQNAEEKLAHIQELRQRVMRMQGTAV